GCRSHSCSEPSNRLSWRSSPNSCSTRSAVSCRWFRTVSAFTKSPTGNTSFSKSAALANGIKDAHFVSRYSISGLVCPLSQLLIGRNVWGPSVAASVPSGPAGVVRPRRRLGKRPPPGPSWPQPPALCRLTQTRVGLFQAEPIRLQRSEFVQSSIDALKALVQHGAEQVPAPCRLTRAGLGQDLNTSLQPYGIGHCGTLSLPLQH